MAKRRVGRLITFEGSEGCGKSTQARLLCAYLKKKNNNVLLLREPGGVKISEKIRNLLLDKRHTNMVKSCEVLLYLAARAQLVEELILPSLKQGNIIVCDRFLDSTIAYQGYGCGVDVELIKQMGSYATSQVNPDITFLLDMETKKSFLRIRQPRDRIEERSLVYHRRVRQGYLKLAQHYPERIKVIPAHQSREDIQRCIQGYINQWLERS